MRNLYKNIFKAISDSEKTIFFTFFPSIIFIGSVLLYLPGSFGNPQIRDLSYVDALFTAVSAVCVTGLITVDTSMYTPLGQWIILILIQLGGLGIISLSTLYLALPGKKISLKSRKVIRGYYIEKIEYDPKKIVQHIVVLTLGIQLVGTILLYLFFRQHMVDRSFFTALFHSVSAFCNAGFSLFATSLEEFSQHTGILTTIMVLIVLGGLSFIVIQDIALKVLGSKQHRFLSFHTKIVLIVTILLITIGTGFFLLLENEITLVSAMFQSITSRTAGFNSIQQESLTDASKLVTMFLMLIGGAPGSIAGGIKVTTFFLLLILILKKPLDDGSIQVFNRSISHEVISNANVFLIKALTLVFLSILSLTITENLFSSYSGLNEYAPSFLDLMFESISAFGTVGLSIGVTGQLSVPGKIVLMVIMFSGRIGLITMAMPVGKRIVDSLIRYPSGEVMIG